LGVKNILKDVPAKDFNCPGSIIKVAYDTGHPIAFGMQQRGMGLFSGAGMRGQFLGGYVFETPPEDVTSEESGSQTGWLAVAAYPSESLLISGWLIGSEKIEGKTAILHIPVGKGHIILFGFNVLNRGYSLATFKLLFNALYYSTSRG
jgi:hypothetical protein